MKKTIDCYDKITKGVVPLPETGGRRNPGVVGGTPKLRGGNAELFEVKVFDNEGRLKKIISKEEIEAREKAKKNETVFS